MNQISLPHHRAIMTCGGVTGHAQDCDRSTCERILHGSCRPADLHHTESGQEVVFTRRTCAVRTDTTWRYTVEGAACSDGTVQRSDEESGTVEAETLGDALIAITRSATFWDWVDQNEKVTFTFERVTEDSANDSVTPSARLCVARTNGRRCGAPVERVGVAGTRWQHVDRAPVYGHEAQPELAHPMNSDPFAGADL